jgi:hypothetical protein
MTDTKKDGGPGELEKIVWVSPAFDKRSDDPKKNYGIGSCRITFILKGPLGAVQFMVGTNWHLPRVQREKRDWQHDFNTRFDKINPEGWDVGYHSPKPMYDDQTPVASCDLFDPCYYDGSSLMADEWVPHFIEGGTDWLWPKLEEQYRETFCPECNGTGDTPTAGDG